MKTIKETQYLLFEEQQTKTKTKVIHVVNRHHEDVIGVIKWYGSWRQYCFYPAYDTVWNIVCLTDVNEVISELMQDRKDQEMIIVDYPNRLTEKKITEEGQKRLRELQKFISEFMKEYDIHIVTGEGKRII